MFLINMEIHRILLLIMRELEKRFGNNATISSTLLLSEQEREVQFVELGDGSKMLLLKYQLLESIQMVQF